MATYLHNGSTEHHATTKWTLGIIPIFPTVVSLCQGHGQGNLWINLKLKRETSRVNGNKNVKASTAIYRWQDEPYCSENCHLGYCPCNKYSPVSPHPLSPSSVTFTIYMKMEELFSIFILFQQKYIPITTLYSNIPHQQPDVIEVYKIMRRIDWVVAQSLLP